MAADLGLGRIMKTGDRSTPIEQQRLIEPTTADLGLGRSIWIRSWMTTNDLDRRRESYRSGAKTDQLGNGLMEEEEEWCDDGG
ncbi:hypothetical protein Dsin_008953 [Dipteronia sinensis]|uniref:Uncharacterized protein n=1 Tax=Dipteronia sinensis TaxID=43782 RepID=A0AAE0AQ55_9ROSI|nr:hypothetical protein Dsin_008953 [Dipteronia sinensis]